MSSLEDRHDDVQVSNPAATASPTRLASTDRGTVAADRHLLAVIHRLADDVERLRQQPHSSDAKLAVTERAKELVAETAERFACDDTTVSLVVSLVLDLPPSSVGEQLRELRERIDVLYQLQKEHAAAPPASSILVVSMTIARLAFATAVGSLLGGPLIAMTLGEPLFDKAFEGAIGGLLGGATSEINDRLRVGQRSDT